MNRKIMLLPLTAALLFGLASCGPTGGSEDVVSSSEDTAYDGGVSDLEVGTVAVSGVVGHKGAKGWTLDDGKASAYVYGALADDIKVGDHVTVTGECVGYYGLYELKNCTVNKAASNFENLTLATPVEITAAEAKAAWDVLSTAASADATWKPTNSKRYKITGLTAEDVDEYAGWTLSGLTDAKLVSYYYVPGNNVTAASQSTQLYAGCKYDVSFYIGGTNSKKNINMNIFDVTAHYDAVTSVTVTGDADVKVGAEVSLTASVLPASADQGLTWTTSDASIATVNNGKVKGVAAGNVTITATSTADNSKKAEFAMTVSEVTSFKEIPAEGITLTAAAFGDNLGNGSYKAAVDVTVGGLSWKASANTNLLAGTYGSWEGKVLQTKKDTGVFLALNDAVKSVKSITINYLNTFESEGAAYLPTLQVGDQSIACNELTGVDAVSGTKTGIMNGQKEICKYVLTYDVSSISETVFGFVAATGAANYLESIVIK